MELTALELGTLVNGRDGIPVRVTVAKVAPLYDTPRSSGPNLPLHRFEKLNPRDVTVLKT